MTFVGTVLAGISDGSLYALVAVGFSLIFSSSGVIDFARGQLVIVGTLGTYLLVETQGWNRWAALVVLMGLVAAIGGIEQITAVLPLRGDARTAGWLVSTLGFGIAVQAIVSFVAGGGSHNVREPFGTSTFSIGDTPFDGYRLIVIGITGGVVAVTWVVLRYSNTGRCLRAVAEDNEAAALRGINVRAFTIGTFMVAGALAGFAGLVFVPLTTAFLSQAPLFTIKGFIAMVVGGTGSVWGALVGGWTLGMAEQLGSRYLDASSQDLFGLAVLLVILLIRPQGIFASPQLRRA
jgi:branched-chain amino acid transport system permease protein